MFLLMSQEIQWSVPPAVFMGGKNSNAAPFHSGRASDGKAPDLWTALAFIMSIIAFTLPKKMVILPKMLKDRLIGVFIGVVACGILMVGYLFNLVI